MKIIISDGKSNQCRELEFLFFSFFGNKRRNEENHFSSFSTALGVHGCLNELIFHVFHLEKPEALIDNRVVSFFVKTAPLNSK